MYIIVFIFKQSSGVGWGGRRGEGSVDRLRVFRQPDPEDSYNIDTIWQWEAPSKGFFLSETILHYCISYLIGYLPKVRLLYFSCLFIFCNDIFPSFELKKEGYFYMYSKFVIQASFFDRIRSFIYLFIRSFRFKNTSSMIFQIRFFFTIILCKNRWHAVW